MALIALAFLTAPCAMGAERRADPGFVTQAEQKYADARRARLAAQDVLTRLRNEAAAQSEAAMGKTGQWIEPEELWRRELAAQRSVAFAKSQERQAFEDLNRARDIARRHRFGFAPQSRIRQFEQ